MNSYKHLICAIFLAVFCLQVVLTTSKIPSVAKTAQETPNKYLFSQQNNNSFDDMGLLHTLSGNCPVLQQREAIRYCQQRERSKNGHLNCLNWSSLYKGEIYQTDERSLSPSNKKDYDFYEQSTLIKSKIIKISDDINSLRTDIVLKKKQCSSKIILEDFEKMMKIQISKEVLNLVTLRSKMIPVCNKTSSPLQKFGSQEIKKMEISLLEKANYQYKLEKKGQYKYQGGNCKCQFKKHKNKIMFSEYQKDMQEKKENKSKNSNKKMEKLIEEEKQKTKILEEKVDKRREEILKKFTFKMKDYLKEIGVKEEKEVKELEKKTQLFSEQVKKQENKFTNLRLRDLKVDKLQLVLKSRNQLLEKERLNYSKSKKNYDDIMKKTSQNLSTEISKFESSLKKFSSTMEEQLKNKRRREQDSYNKDLEQVTKNLSGSRKTRLSELNGEHNKLMERLKEKKKQLKLRLKQYKSQEDLSKFELKQLSHARNSMSKELAEKQNQRENNFQENRERIENNKNKQSRLIQSSLCFKKDYRSKCISSKRNLFRKWRSSMREKLLKDTSDGRLLSRNKIYHSCAKSRKWSRERQDEGITNMRFHSKKMDGHRNYHKMNRRNMRRKMEEREAMGYRRYDNMVSQRAILNIEKLTKLRNKHRERRRLEGIRILRRQLYRFRKELGNRLSKKQKEATRKLRKDNVKRFFRKGFPSKKRRENIQKEKMRMRRERSDIKYLMRKIFRIEDSIIEERTRLQDLISQHKISMVYIKEKHLHKMEGIKRFHDSYTVDLRRIHSHKLSDIKRDYSKKREEMIQDHQYKIEENVRIHNRKSLDSLHDYLSHHKNLIKDPKSDSFCTQNILLQLHDFFKNKSSHTTLKTKNICRDLKLDAITLRQSPSKKILELIDQLQIRSIAMGPQFQNYVTSRKKRLETISVLKFDNVMSSYSRDSVQNYKEMLRKACGQSLEGEQSQAVVIHARMVHSWVQKQKNDFLVKKSSKKLEQIQQLSEDNKRIQDFKTPAILSNCQKIIDLRGNPHLLDLSNPINELLKWYKLEDKKISKITFDFSEDGARNYFMKFVPLLLRSTSTIQMGWIMQSLKDQLWFKFQKNEMRRIHKFEEFFDKREEMVSREMDIIEDEIKKRSLADIIKYLQNKKNERNHLLEILNKERTLFKNHAARQIVNLIPLEIILDVALLLKKNSKSTLLDITRTAIKGTVSAEFKSHLLLKTGLRVLKIKNDSINKDDNSFQLRSENDKNTMKSLYQQMSSYIDKHSINDISDMIEAHEAKRTNQLEKMVESGTTHNRYAINDSRVSEIKDVVFSGSEYLTEAFNSLNSFKGFEKICLSDHLLEVKLQKSRHSQTMLKTALKIHSKNRKVGLNTLKDKYSNPTFKYDTKFSRFTCLGVKSPSPVKISVCIGSKIKDNATICIKKETVTKIKFCQKRIIDSEKISCSKEGETEVKYVCEKYSSLKNGGKACISKILQKPVIYCEKYSTFKKERYCEVEKVTYGPKIATFMCLKENTGFKVEGKEYDRCGGFSLVGDNEMKGLIKLV